MSNYTRKMNSRYSAYLIIAVLASLICNGCSPNKQLIARQTLDEANKLFAAGNYQEAYSKFSSPTAQLAVWDSATYRAATISASFAGKDSIACEWGSRYSSIGDRQKLTALSKSLENIGDENGRTDLILSDTTSFFSIVGEQKVLGLMAKRLAQNQDKGLVELYGRIEDKSVKTEIFDAYFSIAKKVASDKQLERDCKEILKIQPDQKAALSYLGKKRYEDAESTYAKLMSDYNKKKTQAAYAYLTRDLKKVVTPLYKESKMYFERLRKNDPENVTYIKYLININDRLSNQAEVKRLKKLIK